MQRWDSAPSPSSTNYSAALVQPTPRSLHSHRWSMRLRRPWFTLRHLSSTVLRRSFTIRSRQSSFIQTAMPTVGLITTTGLIADIIMTRMMTSSFEVPSTARIVRWNRSAGTPRLAVQHQRDQAVRFRLFGNTRWRDLCVPAAKEGVGLSRTRRSTVGPQNYEAEVRKTLTDPEKVRPDAEILLSELHGALAAFCRDSLEEP
jgi:hypothetical protein